MSRIELIHDWYAAIKAGDIAGALAKLDPDVEWIDDELHETGALDDVRAGLAEEGEELLVPRLHP